MTPPAADEITSFRQPLIARKSGSPKSTGEEGHRSRLREKFLNFGLTKLTDDEILELLLTLSTPRQDCKVRARQLLQLFGSLGTVLETDPQLLAEVPGIGPKNILGLKLVPAVAERYLEDRLKDKNKSTLDFNSQVWDFLSFSMRALSREVFRVIFLDARHQVCGMEDLFSGTHNQAVVYPREVIASALKHKAISLICAHNHPSGDHQPSRQDHDLTRRLYHACRAVDLELADHLVVGAEKIYSFSRQGDLQALASEYASFNL